MRSILLFILFTQNIILFSQKRVVGAIGFYNVENLFDLQDDPDKNDEDFLPTGRNEWDATKYDEKLANLSKVLSTMANGADIIGLAEIENKLVIEDLIATKGLSNFNYKVVHKDSPDRRGIDVGLIYKEDRFKVIHSTWIKFPDPNYITRDILLCTGIYFGDTITIAINHWPSRRGGGVDKRNIAGARLKQAVDSINQITPNAKIIIMGDFNDDPRDASIKKSLGATDKENKVEKGGLFNTSAYTFKQGYTGTLSYRGAWNVFDQVIVSEGLLSGSGVTYKTNTYSIFGPNWMKQQDGQYAGTPLRSFGGGKYLGGYSDHFPVYILLEK